MNASSSSVVLETIKTFHLFEFETSLLVCDGASSNLSAIKQMLGVSGRDTSQADTNAISSSFYVHVIVGSGNPCTLNHTVAVASNLLYAIKTYEMPT